MSMRRHQDIATVVSIGMTFCFQAKGNFGSNSGVLFYYQGTLDAERIIPIDFESIVFGVNDQSNAMNVDKIPEF